MGEGQKREIAKIQFGIQIKFFQVPTIPGNHPTPPIPLASCPSRCIDCPQWPRARPAPEAIMPAPAKVSYTHDAMIDLIIAHPSISNNELAAHFGYTAAWCSMIKSSDAFKARLAARRSELVDPVIVMTLEDKIRGVTERAVDVIAEKLSMPPALVPDAVALRAAEFGAKAMGLGQARMPPPVDPDHLKALGERLLALQRSLPGRASSQEIEDVDARVVESKAQA